MAYLAKIVREITVINPSFRSKELQETSYAKTRTPSLERTFSGPISEPKLDLFPPVINEKPEKQNQPLDINFDLKPPDLTLYLMENWDAGVSDQGFIIIQSPYLQPGEPEMYKTPPGLSKWLEHQYLKFIQYGKLEKEQALLLMQGFGRELYKKFAPPAFKQAFWELVHKLGPDFDSIQILSNNPLLPWELMKPLGPDSFEERNFLGLEFKIGRWHISQSSLQSERPPQRVRFQELVAIAPQYQGKQTLSAQAQELKVLEAIDGYRRVSGRLDGIKALFGKFPRGIIHFAGHGIIRCSEQGVTDYLILLEDAELDVLAWKGLIHGKREQSPFFFFNACDAGKAEQIANFVDGWAPAVLEAGACGYVGALWPLNDKGAAEFATHFYHAMTEKPETNPADVAEILRETRSLFLENGDPTFLAYIFYGDPYLKLVRY